MNASSMVGPSIGCLKEKTLKTDRSAAVTAAAPVIRGTLDRLHLSPPRYLPGRGSFQ